VSVSPAKTADGTATALPPAVPIAIAVSWLVIIGAQVWGVSEAVHHDALVEGDLPLWVSVGVFILAWQSMTAAMMLPTSLPMVRLFNSTSRTQPDRAAVNALFLLAYAVVWTGFGIAAFLGDVALHRFVDATPWLEARPWVVSAAVLALAGAFQFSSLKDKCLHVCQHPAIFMWRHYRRGRRAAFEIGLRHGMFCLGCCWALMLVMFAVGVANLIWMAALTAVMVYEKTGRLSGEIVRAAGIALLLMAAVMAVTGAGF
jgi:predicted metal-binding membrane protein